MPILVVGGLMKEIYMLVGFGAGLVTGMLIYKHSQEAKKTC